MWDKIVGELLEASIEVFARVRAETTYRIVNISPKVGIMCGEVGKTLTNSRFPMRDSSIGCIQGITPVEVQNGENAT